MFAAPNLLFAGGLDPLVAAHRAKTGATDLKGLNDLIRYVRGQSLLSNFVIYPMKSAQSYGSGSTVAPLGGLTSNAMTLVNSPTWGASGIEFDGINQHGAIPDFLGSSSLTTFSRHKFNSLVQSASNVVWSQQQFSTDDRSLSLTVRNDLTGDPYALVRSSDGTSSALEVFQQDASSYSTTEKTSVAQWVDGDGRFLWTDKTSDALSLQTGTPQTSSYNTSVDVLFAAQSPNAPAGFPDMLGVAQAFFTSALTTTQRETITDLINAL